MECPICTVDVADTAMRTLDCGGNHSMCATCLQTVVTGLGGPVGTGDQGPRGSLISYVNLPGCPFCRGRFHLAPHVADPMGLDNYPNNHPDGTALPRFYYDATQGLTPAEVQTWVFDAADADIAAVNDAEDDAEINDESDNEGHDYYSGEEEATDEDNPGQQVGMDMNDDDDDDDDAGGATGHSLGYEFCNNCNQQAEFIRYDTGAQYRQDSLEDNYVCPGCGAEVVNADQDVTACMGCHRGWHQACYT